MASNGAEVGGKVPLTVPPGRRDSDIERRFQKERMKVPMVPDDWEAESFTKGLNPDSSVVSLKLKESLTKFEAIT
ncbi:hypothetical protein HAX54_039071 [Datura stramonium]|uniref:Uncharacterized protein n=1 Tax=Datura stramonium TaxID=4076 RepID=A0ABS8VM59_DATST|nr:hypothetical protein [Datura stramonium]